MIPAKHRENLDEWSSEYCEKRGTTAPILGIVRFDR
jgi:hypothetical protein